MFNFILQYVTLTVFSCRKSLLLASGILVAGGTAAYMQSRLRNNRSGAFGQCNGPGGLAEGSENDISKNSVSKGKKKNKNALRSLQVLAAILLSQMGRRGARDLLALVSVVVSFFIDCLESDILLKLMFMNQVTNTSTTMIK